MFLNTGNHGVFVLANMENICRWCCKLILMIIEQICIATEIKLILIKLKLWNLEMVVILEHMKSSFPWDLKLKQFLSISTQVLC